MLRSKKNYFTVFSDHQVLQRRDGFCVGTRWLVKEGLSLKAGAYVQIANNTCGVNSTIDVQSNKERTYIVFGSNITHKHFPEQYT
jgi:hypothetical protein